MVSSVSADVTFIMKIDHVSVVTGVIEEVFLVLHFCLLCCVTWLKIKLLKCNGTSIIIDCWSMCLDAN